jgi:molecular chaperone DnaK (HSP70)
MMRGMAFFVLSLALLAGCGEKSPLSVPVTVVEATSPVVGANSQLSQSVGIETLGGVFTPLLLEGSAVPCKVSKIFSTAADNQTQITVKLYRGVGMLAVDCEPLGQYKVVGIPPASRGTPGVEITLAVQADSILLAAKDLSTGQPMKIKQVEISQPSH